MSRNKYAYFQGGGGVNEPTPHEKKYKSEKAIVVQPRFKEPFYRNYDLYETEGVDGPPKLGPGAGWHHMDRYKSVSEFLADKRKHMKDKYKADDSWIEDTKSNQNERIERMKTRASIFNRIIKFAQRNYDLGKGLYENMDKYKSVEDFRDGKDVNSLDFATDSQIGSGSIIGNEGSVANSVYFGGNLDEYLPQDDFEGKSPDKLDFGRDYEGEYTEPKKKPKNIEELLQAYEAGEKDIPPYGLPEGIEQEEELTQPNKPNSEYGTTDSGNTVYNKMWFV